MTNFSDIRVDTAAQTITVGGGVKMVRIRDALRPHRLQTEVTPEIGSATAGSVACCGTKDASIGPDGLGQVSSSVIGVRMVTAQGEVESISEDSDPERLREIRSSYGLLGVIFEVTFRTQPGTTLRYDYKSFPLRTLSLLGGFRAHRSDSTIDFKFNRRHYFDFTFWAIPWSRWPEFVPAYLKFCADFKRETGFRASLISEVYFMARDNNSLMSPTAGESVFTMDCVDTRMNDPLWIEFNRRFNSVAANHGGRPLLNQTKQMSKEIVYQTLGSDWEGFLRIREAQDPDGRFLNDFFKDLM